MLEINVLPSMTGKNLIELELPKKYGIIVAVIKKKDKLIRPFPNQKLEDKDKLLLVCTEDAIAKMIEDNR